jgi:uncharacterized membrane protein YeaQ/YmgE (transglycosylase-associated protein family)
MSFYHFLILIIIAGICGSIAQSLVGFSKGGCVLSIVTGFIGALIGGWISKHFSLPDFFIIHIGGKSFPVVWSIIGAIIFTAILGALFPRSK